MNYEVRVILNKKKRKGVLCNFKYDYRLPIPRVNEVIIHKGEFYDVTGVGHDYKSKTIIVVADARI